MSKPAAADPILEISRDDIVLGRLRRTEAIELLRVGFLKPSDQYHSEGDAELRPLNDLLQPSIPDAPSGIVAASARRTPWLGKAKSSVSTAAGAVTGAAGQVGARLRTLTATALGKARHASNLILQGYIPQLRRLLEQLPETRPVAAVRRGIRDEALMRKVFGALYDCLPKPVCRFIPEQRFVQFCMDNQSKLLRRDSDQTPP